MIRIIIIFLFSYLCIVRGLFPADGGLSLAEIVNLSLQEKQKQTRRYEGDIRQDDLRVYELRNSLLKKAKLPAGIRLRYSGTNGNFLVFYDLEGQRIFYKYKEDRFDRRAEKKISVLIKGAAYLVTGKFRGVILENKIVEKTDRKFYEYLKNTNSIILFEYQKVRPLRIEQIIF